LALLADRPAQEKGKTAKQTHLAQKWHFRQQIPAVIPKTPNRKPIWHIYMLLRISFPATGYWLPATDYRLLRACEENRITAEAQSLPAGRQDAELISNFELVAYVLHL
jgi:hypothetical protein